MSPTMSCARAFPRYCLTKLLRAHISPCASHPHAQHAPLPLPFHAACRALYSSPRAAAAGDAGDAPREQAECVLVGAGVVRQREKERGGGAETGSYMPLPGVVADFEAQAREQAECVVVGGGMVGLGGERSGGTAPGEAVAGLAMSPPVDFEAREREQAECAVVGAGVVGLAVARALAVAGREVVVVEAGSGVGGGISSRNSEVIHAGLYYPHGSLKARLCVEGRRQLYAFCEDRGVPHRRVGKLVVATSADQVPQLENLKASSTALPSPTSHPHLAVPPDPRVEETGWRGFGWWAGRRLTHAEGNGVEGLQMVGREEASRMEPRVECQAALLSPHTGIVNSHALMLALERRQRQKQQAPIKPQLPPLRLPPLYLARGHYFAHSGPPPFSRLVYPLPEPGGLGVHATVDLAGRVRFGPDVQWLHAVPLSAAHGMPISYDYSVDPARAESFYSAIRKYFPTLQSGSLHADYAGIRPKITAPGETAADFLIQTHATHGMPGLIHLLGIESPGLTSCLAIAKYVKSLL
ncbi:unnamed protein product [Closterium sp. NIES-65]|nr:unnamed protein product [Closterium sp. NIES-65]